MHCVRLPFTSSLLLLVLLIGIGLAACDSGGSGPPDPEIAGLQPASGPPGTLVTIEGSGFGEDSSRVAVAFDGTEAGLNRVASTTIEAVVPQSLSPGPVDVEVSVRGQVVDGPAFSVERKAPGIASVQPDSGAVGTPVTIRGMNFSSSAADNTIRFDGIEAPVHDATTDRLETEVPKGASDGPIEVTVGQKSTIGPDFNVITDGTMEVVTSTSGSDHDPNGYTITVDGSSSKSADTNDATFFSDLQEGSHDAELSGIAENCSAEGSNPRSVNITAGDTTTTTFDVRCEAVATNQIVFHSDRDGDDEIFLMNADGSNPRKLTNNSATDEYAAISNDGTKIAFVSDRGGSEHLYVMDADGTDARQLTGLTGFSGFPTWSPNDSKIAFDDERSGNREIYTINADASGRTRITNNSASDFSPTWSPDGSKIAFTSDRDGDKEIYSINPDGTGLRQITTNSDFDGSASWSPGGSKIAFLSDRDGNFEIYTMNVDGTGLSRITNHPALDDSPSWSPDGSELVFFTERDGNGEIYKVNADGSGNLVNLTVDSARDIGPDWSPVP